MKSNNRNTKPTCSKCFQAFNVQNVHIIAFQLVQQGLDKSIQPAAKWDFGLYDFGSYRQPSIKSFNFDIADAKCVSIPNFENKASNFMFVQWLNKFSFRRLGGGKGTGWKHEQSTVMNENSNYSCNEYSVLEWTINLLILSVSWSLSLSRWLRSLICTRTFKHAFCIRTN